MGGGGECVDGTRRALSGLDGLDWGHSSKGLLVAICPLLSQVQVVFFVDFTLPFHVVEFLAFWYRI